MKIVKAAQAGSLESCDILISVEPVKKGAGIEIDLDSPALKSFGEQIENEILKVVKELAITDVKISAVDKGALNYCIRARTEAALQRSMNKE